MLMRPMTAPGTSEKMPAFQFQAHVHTRPLDARDLSHTGSQEYRKWETKPNVENPSSAARGDQRPRPLCVCSWTEMLSGCGAAQHSATGTHTHPRPPGAVPATQRTRRSGASRCGLRLAARHAIEHPPANTQGAAVAEPPTRVLQTGFPNSPLPP